MSQQEILEPTRMKDLWFPHGDLILRAEDTVFRVHSDIVGARSSVFGDMTTFPQPEKPDGDIIDA
jgi:hypothetical protein